MTNYFMSHELYQELVEKDKKIIEKMNSGGLSYKEGEKELKELWGLGKRKK